LRLKAAEDKKLKQQEGGDQEEENKEPYVPKFANVKPVDKKANQKLIKRPMRRNQLDDDSNFNMSPHKQSRQSKYTIAK